jgi:hypothetical protein
MAPIVPQTPRHRERAARRARGPGIARDAIVAVCVVALIALLILLGRGGGDSGKDVGATTTPTATAPAHRAAPTTTTPRGPARPATVSVRLVPRASVWVCLRDAARRTTRVVGVVGPTSTLRTYTSSRFTLTVGNGSMDLSIDHHVLDVPASSTPLSYEITPDGHRRIHGTRAPDCRS